MLAYASVVEAVYEEIPETQLLTGSGTRSLRLAAHYLRPRFRHAIILTLDAYKWARSLSWLERTVHIREVEGSSPSAPTIRDMLWDIPYET